MEPAGLALALEFFQETQWAACRVECVRLLKTDPGHTEARLLQYQCESRLGWDRRKTFQSLASDPATPPTIARMACYEFARGAWKTGDWSTAAAQMEIVFRTAPEEELFLRSGYSLACIFDEAGTLLSPSDALRAQLASCQELWTPRIKADCAFKRSATSTAWTGKPGEWIVAFYRAQIRPAIGNRCSLTPSCSEYTLSALKQHGVLGFALMADRFFREPGVVSAAANPVPDGDIFLYADPLSDHDWWLKGRTP